MLSKRMLALTLLAAALAVMPTCVLRAQWIQTNGLPGEYVESLVADGSNLLAGSYSDGLFFSSDLGSSWSADTLGLGNPCIYSLLNYKSTVFCVTPAVGGSEWGVFRSNDAKTWVNLDSGLLQVNPYGLGAKDSNLFVGNYLGIWRSTNNGQYWEPSSSGLMLSSTSYVSSFCTIDSILYAGTGGGGYSGMTGSGVFRSLDNGDNWVPFNNGLPDGTRITVLVSSNKTLFAATYDDGIYALTDNDSNWKACDTGLTNLAMPSLIEWKNNLFAATADGIFLSINSGRTWSNVSLGLSNQAQTYVYSLAVVDTFIFVGTWGYGVWRRPLSDFGISSVAQTPNTPSPQIQIFPNPFSQFAQITFTSPSAGYADVSIANMLGAQVAQLFSGELDEGEHSFLWSNPTGLPDGTYECLVRMNGQVQTLPVVLLH